MMKKITSILLAVLLLVLMLAGCGKQEKAAQSTSSGKEKVTIALWGNDLLEHHTAYLVKKFPNVEFKFVLATIPRTTITIAINTTICLIS